MRKAITLGLMVFGLFATSVEAKTKHCRTNEDCQKLKAEVEADLELLRDVTPYLTGALKTEVSQEEAERICQDEGMRLPTARELALVAQNMGAQGISETKKDGYILVKGSDSAGNPDHFYFSYKGYTRPEGKLDRQSLWSSSLHPGDPSLAYNLIALNGMLELSYRSNTDIGRVVRCVRSL